MVRLHRSAVLAMFGLAVGAHGCSDDPSPVEQPAPEAGAGTAETAVTDVDALRIEYTFEGRWASGEGFTFGPLVPVARQAPATSGLRSVAQPGYCAQEVDADGVEGSNPPDTFEIVTDASTFFEFGPFEWTMGAGCDATGHVPAPVTTNYTPDGVTCADVTVRSFYSVPFTNVHAEITEFGGTSAHAGYVFPDGTGAPDPDGPGGILTQYGLWFYGDIDAAGGAGDEATVQWTFRNTDASPFDFRGRVIAEVTEVCGNGLDDDCDGRADEGCGTYPITDPCVDDADCTTGFCDASNFCGAATCSNGSQDGGETDVDCGGAGCPGCSDGLLCLVDSDCASTHCNTTGVAETRCRANANPGVGDVVFTEFLANIGGDDTVPDYAGEWFEVYNASAGPVSLEGCVFADDGGESSQLFGSEYVIAPGEYHVFTRTAAPGYLTAAVPAARLHEIGGITLGNTSDELRLSCGGTEIDAISWDDADLVQTTEAVASQVDPGALSASGNDDRHEFCAAAAVYGNDGSLDHLGTPGAANASCPEYTPSFCRFQWPTARPTQAAGGTSFSAWGRVYAAGYTDVTAGFNDAQPTRFVAQFGYGSVGADPNTPGAFLWDDMVPNGGYDCSGCGSPENNNDEYQYTLTVPSTPGTTYDLAMRFSGDLGATWTVCDTGNGSSDGWASGDAAQLEVIVPPAAPAARGDLVFTELMINLPGSSDTGEYAEMVNTTGTTLDLQGCTMEDEDGLSITYASSIVVAPGGYAVFGAPGATSEGWAPNQLPISAGVTLDNTGDGLTLTCGGVVIDEVSFSADVDVEGRSWQLDPSAIDADLNDLDVTFGGQDLKTWWCDAPLVAGSFDTWFDDGLGGFVPLYGSPGAANTPCVTVDYCRLDNPRELTDVAADSVNPIEGQVYVAGLTDQGTGNNAHHMLQVQFGVGTDGSADPANDFAWTGADPIVGWDGSVVGEPNNDGFEGVLTAPSSGGESRDYAFRVSGDNGTTWTYCDGVVGGSNGSVDGYQAANAGQISTQVVCGAGFWGPPACTTPCNCDDGLYCNGVEVCDNVLGCQAGTPPVAPDDGVACTVATCNEGTDSFDQVPNDTLCDDLLFCNGAETCSVGIGCVPGAAPTLTDGVGCTTDACDEVNDVVTHTPNDAACDDSLFCTGVEICNVLTGCEVASTPPLDDGVACTDDACDEINDVVVHTANDANCDDGAFCNGVETCDATLDCQSGVAPTLSDGVDCTDDTCDETNDIVVNATNDANCDDSFECTADVCDGTTDCGYSALPDETACGSCESGVCECWTGICANTTPYSIDVRSVLTHDCVMNGTDSVNDGMDASNFLFMTDAIHGDNLPNNGVIGGNMEHPALELWWNDSDDGNNCWNAGLAGGTRSFAVPDVAQPSSITYEAEGGLPIQNAVGFADGDGWAANSGTSGYIVYGPYVTTLNEGYHYADFRLLVDVAGTNHDHVISIDVWDSEDGVFLAQRNLYRDDFAANFAYETFTLGFDMVGREGHPIETRVHAESTSYVRADSVTIRERPPHLHIVGTSVDGSSDVSVTIHLADVVIGGVTFDGGTVNHTHVFPDWFNEAGGGVSSAIDGLDRITTGGAYFPVADPGIFYTTVELTGGIDQVDITQTSGGRFIFFGAVLW